ncbi:MAG: citrate lyase acyl carrier protein [Eubacteriaceae bacterium]
MTIIKSAVAGTLESSDTYIHVEPDEEELIINIDSVVGNQYHEAILKTVTEVLKDLQVNKGKITVKDRGALDCVIRARLETAVKRGGD